MFGAVALVGAVGAASMQVMKGPVRAMSEVTKRTVAENNMIASTKLAIMAATNQAGGGDCDGDMIVEPIPAEDPAGLPVPSGGGLLPATIGASLQDPWNTRYALCAWDHGANNGRCGGTAGLIAGGPTEDQYVLAVISAGPDRQFQTTCRAYVDANTDNIPDQPLLEKPAGSDDLVLGYTYAEANSAGGGLWVLKTGDPDKATIVKDLEVRTADDSQVAFSLDRSTGETEFLAIKTDNIYARTSPNGHVAMQDPLRIKTIIGLAAPPSGGGGMGALPNGQIWIGDAADEAQPQTLSGDATLSNAGALTIANDAINNAKIANNAVTSDKIADGTIVAADITNATITMNKLSAGGTANGTTFLRGDGQWVAPSITETDPQVGAVTNNKWCRGDGTAVVCDQDEPTGGAPAQTCSGGTNPQVYDGRCYTLMPSQPWTASGPCQGWGGSGATMVIINDAAEQTFITAQYAASQPWIGLTDSGAHGSSENNPRWVNGTTTAAYSNWNATTNQNSSRDYVRLNTNGTWRYEAYANRPILCESNNAYSLSQDEWVCSGGEKHMQAWTSGSWVCDSGISFHQCQYGSAVYLGAVPAPGCSAACFGAGSQVLLADGGTKVIEALEVGDKVLGRGGITNTVIALKPTSLGDRKLYTINGTLKVTADHPAMTERGWGVISRALYAQRYHKRTMPVTIEDGQQAAWDTSFLPPEEMVEFGIGDNIAFGNHGFQKITSLTSETLPGDTPLYTVALDGDGTFQLEGGYVFIGLSGSLAKHKQAGMVSAKENGAFQNNKKQERAAWEHQY